MKNTSQKVLVVGAGVIGSSLAEELTRRGASVTLIDAAEVGSGTSSATFAWINSNNKSPAAYSHLNVLGLQAHERVARTRTPGGQRWFHQTGTVQIAQTGEELEALELKVRNFNATNYDAHLLTPEEVRELEPNLAPRQLVGGAFYAKEGWIDVQKMCMSLVNRAIQAGATYAPFERVVEVRPKQVTTEAVDGTLRHHTADVVILAAGNGTRKILAGSGVDFPILDAEGGKDTRRATVGIISTTGPVQSGIKHFVRANGIALRPARNGGITFADHPTGGKWEVDDPRIWTVPELLLDRVRQLYPTMKQAWTESVSLGTRVLPEDGLTIADWIGDDNCIYAVATHSGVTLAAHLAESVADEVLTGTRHASLQTFGLSRFAGV
ncbi:NAD(P)/FAD-dependent oxidoreductase [Pseudarthrobacter sp. YAF2]|uniref:NAD(P)/FAD-dependent oxidoreductase n=1 Tax=Pseudarthrobacter sp. YAF2 TaxID=3233078 RepID=UPI003F947690